MAFNKLWGWITLLLAFNHATEAHVWEAEALLKFQDGVVDKHNSLYGWGNITSDPCGVLEDLSDAWIGVACVSDTNSGGRTVWKLDLSRSSLSGSIAEALSGLKNLTYLDLTANSFSGPIPSSLGDLELRELHLGGNLLTGTIPQLPTCILKLTLENNLLSGDINATKVFNLELAILDLRGNDFTGSLPDTLWLSPLSSNISHLDLSHNRLTGRLPSDLGTPGLSLRYLDLSGNNLEGEIPGGIWPTAEYIDLSANDLTGAVPSDVFSNWVAGSYLNLSNNRLTGKIDLTKDTGSSVAFLDLSFNQFEGELETGNALGDNVRTLCLQNNRFSGSLNGIFQCKFSDLRKLAVGNNGFAQNELEWDLTADMAESNFPSLRVLDLQGSNLTGRFPSDLFSNKTFPSLEVLDLSNNFLTGTIPDSLLEMPLLQELRLQTNSLQGPFRLVVNQTNLQVLDLSYNSLQLSTIQMQGMLEYYPSLRELRLAGSNTESIVMPDLPGKLSSLEILDLSSCYLEGPIPDGWNKSNVFLPSLWSLNFSSNSLTGSLPSGFGQMSELTKLDVSSNLLSGELPTFSYHLFNSSAFSPGNDGLCGPPLQPCDKQQSESLSTWEIMVIVVICVIVSGGVALFFGWIWRRKINAKRRQQDAELIAALLDKDTTTIMSLRELRRATDDFSKANQIGMGGFGTVYRGTLDDGTEVAIKRSKHDASSSDEKNQFLNEVRILSQVRHRHLVRLLGCCLAEKEALLVFEFVKNGTLDEYLRLHKGRSSLSWKKRIEIAIQTASALDYLHTAANPPIYHLDVKSANILLDERMNAKVADFGISKLVPAVDVTHITAREGIIGTFGYMDPESVMSSVWTDKSDVYAYGVVLLELITAKQALNEERGMDASLVKWAVPLIQSDHLEEIVDSTIAETLATNRDSIKLAAILATKCLRFQSALRPSMKAVLMDLLCIPHLESVLRESASEDELTD